MADRMLDHRPLFTRVITGPVESVHDRDLVIVTAELDLPVVMSSQDPYDHFRTCHFKRWSFQQHVNGDAWKDERVRSSLEGKVRWSLARDIQEHYPITLMAEVVPDWRYQMMLSR